MDEALRRMLAASWADFAERVKPPTYNDYQRDTEDALYATHKAALETARAIRDDEISPTPLEEEF